MSYLPFPSHVCASCDAGFFDAAKLEYHQILCSISQERRECDLYVGLQAARRIDAHYKRLKISPSAFLPLTLRDKDAEELKRKVPAASASVPEQSTCTKPTSPNVDLIEPHGGPSQPDDVQSSAQLPTQVTPEDRPIASRTRSGPRRLRAVGDQLPVPHSLNGSVEFAPANSIYARHMAFCNQPKPKFLEGPKNKFHLGRRYYSTSLPDHDPEESIGLLDLYDSKYHTREGDDQPNLGPFPNLSSFELGEWYVNAGSQVSAKGLQRLVDIAQAPRFSEEIKEANWPRILAELGANREDLPQMDQHDDHWIDDDGWRSTPVVIPVPIKGTTEDEVVGTLHHRSIVSILREKIANTPDAHLFHHEPFEVQWQPDPSVPPTRVHSELYNSDAFLKAHQDLQNSPRHSGCNRPRVVVGLMFWSDATHMTSFSDDKLWPLYMGFANESKYRRCKPTSDLVHNVAFFDSLSASFKDYVTRRAGGKYPSDPFTAHCRLEMMHAQWVIILDEELLNAIKNGIVIMCQDGVERWFYVRIFTYSANYPEKALIATIRQRGDCLCTRCLVKMTEVDQMGTPGDMCHREERARKDDNARRTLVRDARKLIIPEERKKGVAFGNNKVEVLLKPQSLHSVENAFSQISDIDPNFDIFSTLVVDLLHKFEIGVWKGLFTHLMRVVDACGPGSLLLHELDKRIRLVPNFGKSIRRFSSNISKMTRKTARDYEDVLQCSLPVFDGLIPDPLIQQAVVSIVDLCVRWHALAKLRMHTDETLQMLEDTTIELGNEFRYFAYEICREIPTKELAAEQLNRIRREQKKAESDAKKALTAAKKAEAAAKKAEAAAKKAEAKASKDAELAAKREGKGKKANAKTTKYSTKGTSKGTKSKGPNTGMGKGKAGRGASKTGKGKGKAKAKDVADPEESEDEEDLLESGQTTQPPDAGRPSSTSPTASAPFSSEAPNEVPDAPDDANMEPLPSPIERYDPMPAPGDNEGLGAPVQPKAASTEKPKSDKRKAVNISISTPKFHFLGDYVKTIRFVGTTDNYSSELGELLHRSPKRWYQRSSKRNFRREVFRHERKVGRIKKLRRGLEALRKRNAKAIEGQKAAAQAADIHHYIAKDQNAPVLLNRFSTEQHDLEADPSANTEPRRDPLGVGFVDRLREYLLPNIVALAQEKHLEQLGGEDTKPRMDDVTYPFDTASVSFKGNRIYSHKIMRVKYTTYDVRRREDVLHVNSDVCNVMIPNPDFVDHPDQHPYLYARLLGIFHANVSYMGEIFPGVRYLPPERLQFLWVRWYAASPVESGGGVPLDCISLEPLSSPGSTSFIDPKTVLRAAHIIPRFASKQVHLDGKGTSEMGRDKLDWNQYYVNRYADRDMFMRYNLGMAVGHMGVWSKSPKKGVVLPPHAKRTPRAIKATSSRSKRVQTHGDESITADVGFGQQGDTHEDEDGDRGEEEEEEEEYELDSDMEVDDPAADKNYEIDVEMYGY